MFPSLELFKILENPKLNISIENEIIHFKKDNEIYKVQLQQDNDKITFLSIENNASNNHFVEIINKNFSNVNQIPELIDFIVETDIKNYCIVCHNKLDFQSEELIACANPKCLYKFEEIIVGNFVTDKYNQDPDIFKFHLESAIDAIICERKFDIFEPFPSYFLTVDMDVKRETLSKLSGLDYDNIKDFSKINSILENFDINKLIDSIKQCNTDEQLQKIIKKELYILIRFILMSCKVSIERNDDMLGIKSDKFKIYKIIHQQDKNNEFNQVVGNKPTSYLFHGSRWHNWFSILRNGLKNCSGTKFMTTGAAYGNGIYLSSNINVSYGYGSGNRKSVVGVFELVDKEKFSNGTNIYVVDNEKVLIQRYLLIIPHNLKSEVLKEINDIFNKQIHKEKVNMISKYNKKSISKIIKEYKNLINLKDSKFKIEVDPNYPFDWKIFLTSFEDKYPIAQDMKKFDIKQIELQMKFPDNYPFSPPFIRVVSPRFMHLTGHVTSGGSICHEILTEKGWLPTCSIESLVNIIISEIIEGDGRIDPQKINMPYSYQEAKKSFETVAKSHGWM